MSTGREAQDAQTPPPPEMPTGPSVVGLAVGRVVRSRTALNQAVGTNLGVGTMLRKAPEGVLLDRLAEPILAHAVPISPNPV